MKQRRAPHHGVSHATRAHVRSSLCTTAGLQVATPSACPASLGGPSPRSWRHRSQRKGVCVCASMAPPTFKFAIDRGGTFTDVFAEVPTSLLCLIPVLGVVCLHARHPFAGPTKVICDAKQNTPLCQSDGRLARAGDMRRCHDVPQHEAALCGSRKLPGRADRGHQARAGAGDGPRLPQIGACGHVADNQHTHGHHGAAQLA